VRTKSALFVDFDNVYTGLRRMDPAIADRFAHQPLEWVNWLTDSLGPPRCPHAPQLLRSRVKGLKAGKWGTGGFRGMVEARPRAAGHYLGGRWLHPGSSSPHRTHRRQRSGGW
jgi:hypothetical protein